MIAPVNKLVRQIREALASGGVNAPVESLSAEYARLSTEAAQRLDSCAIMIGQGSDYQALQLAETEPALLDLIAALSFAEAPEWAEFCAAQRLPAASKFDRKSVQALDHLYGKGISPNHPLYKDYRAAVTSRDDVKALQIVRSIARLNPGDINAGAELTRWENKLFQRRMLDLRGALLKGDEPSALNELSELERLTSTEKLAELPEIAQARTLRRANERKAAIELSARLVASLADERQAGSWRMVGDTLARLGDLQAEHGFHLPSASAAVCAEMQDYYDKERALATETARFEKAMSLAGDLAEEANTRLLNRESLTPPETEDFFFDLNRRWKEVEQFDRPVDKELCERVGVAIAALHAELARLRSRRRIKQIAAGMAAALLFAAAAWGALSAWRVQDYARQLTSLQNTGQVEAIEKMGAYLRSEQPGLASRPILRAKLDALGKWTQDARINQSEAEGILADLEKTAAAGFDNAEPATVANQLDTDAKLVAALPAGLQATPRSRLAVARGRFEAYLEGAREKLAAHNDKELSALEALAGTQLTYDQSKETIAGALEQIDPRLKALEALLHPSLKALELPEALQIRVAAVRARVDLFQRELAALKLVNDGLLQATTLDAYREALAGFKESRLTQVAEVNHARKLLASFPKPDDVLAKLLVPGDPAAWGAAKTDISGPAFAPDAVIPAEIGKLLALREDPFLNNIWEASLVDYTRKSEHRDVYSRGELKRDGPREVGDGLQKTSWTGAFFDPSLKAEAISFAPLNLSSTRSGAGTLGTGEIASSRLSAVSQSLARLELNRMTDTAGEKYEKPLLLVFDALVRESDVSPIFKGFMMQQLALMMNFRPNAWAAQYCPSLRADLAKLNQLCSGTALRSQDWLLDRKREDLLPRLAPFFQELASRGYLAEARLNRDLVRAALKAGLHFGGYIDEDLRPHLLGEATAGSSLWAITAQDGAVARFHPPEGDARADAKVDAKFARFSPVFFVPVEHEILDAAAASAKRNAGSPPKPPGIPLFEP